MKLPISIILFLFSLVLFGQTTIGLLHNSPDVSGGYILFGYKQSRDLYLINNCGEVVNQWTTDNRIGVAYVLENGNLLKSGQRVLELRDWDNNLLWKVDLDDYGLSQHHDIEPLPNGNILVLSRDNYPSFDVINQGRNPSNLNGDLDSEKIVEIEPVGTNSLNIVWEWKFWDHLIQDYDATKPNYGVVANHPELIDINLGGATSDWIHANAIDYNSDLDQIVMSSRHMNELYIIDHSTTTAEAASHSGGNSGKGGDFLWRWGNPINYGQGLASDKKMFGQHDPKWIRDGYPNAGKLSVFNNGQDRVPSFSSVHIIDTMVDVNGNYSISGAFLPTDYFWSWDGDVLGETMFSLTQSGAQFQSNGNVLICESGVGRFSEVTSSGNVLWVYKNPLGALTYNQGDNIAAGDNRVFRAEKYPSNYVGFIGKDLTPSSIIEDTNSISDQCRALNIEDLDLEYLYSIYPNPIISAFSIDTNDSINKLSIYNIQGQLVKEYINDQTEYNISDLIAGLYFVSIETNKGNLTKKIIKQ